MYAILDTCVLISALRSSTGASYQILRAVRDGDVKIALSVALALEYESVALRPGLIPGLIEGEIKTREMRHGWLVGSEGSVLREDQER